MSTTTWETLQQKTQNLLSTNYILRNTKQKSNRASGLDTKWLWISVASLDVIVVLDVLLNYGKFTSKLLIMFLTLLP